MGKKNTNKKVAAKDESSDSEQDIDDTEIKAQKTKGNKKKPQGKSFAALQLDSEPEDDKPADASDADSEPNKKVAAATKTKPAGKQKKANRNRKDEDEDLDSILAEIQREYDGALRDVPVETLVAPAGTANEKATTKAKTAKLEVFDEHEGQSETASTVKTAAQKKKEKKEREKLKKLETKKNEASKKPVTNEETAADNDKVVVEVFPAAEQPSETCDGDKDDTAADSKKKKKKKAAEVKEDEDDKKGKKGPNKKAIAAMQEALKQLKLDEERHKQEEEERIHREEEAEAQRLEEIRLEKERKEKKKLKEKERKERLKASGKLLTNKQKADRARAQAMIESLKAQGVEMPEVIERKARPGTRVRLSKLKQQTSTEAEVAKDDDEGNQNQTSTESQSDKAVCQKVAPPAEDIKDTWDAESSSEEEESQELDPRGDKDQAGDSEGDGDDDDNSDSDRDDSESDEDSDDSEGGGNDNRTDAEKRYQKAKERITKRRQEAALHTTVDNLRAAVVCVLGHVDTGKTKILDKLRRTNVQDGEAGGITQQIGATNVPIDAIKEQIKIVKGAVDLELKIPGLLIIDTPGHESFSNLRSRGSSLCDIAILVVDIMHGLEPQTIESLNLLKNKKTPFIVALNKIDRLYDWQTMSRKDVRDIVKNQAANTQLEFEQRSKEVIVQFAEQGLNAALFYENPDPKTFVSLVPTSAVTGEGMGNLLAMIVEFSQTRLAKRLMYSDELQATVLEVKALPGLGTTIDVILVNGTLREGDTMLLAGTDGPLVTQIRSLLMPQPMKELRVKNAYIEYKEIKAAQGVKIAAKDLERAIAGLNLFVARKPDEVDVLRDEVSRELKSALSNIKLQERGVYVQASTLGSLEALLEFLRTSKIPYSNIRIGPVVKRDVMKASTQLEHDSQFATILAFDVKIERDAQEMADNVGVKIFQADIIYHLFDKFIAYRDELKQRKRDEFKNIAVFPCKLKVLPQFVFNSRDPIVAGVMIEAGIVKEGTPICVPSKEFVEIGIVTSIESNHKNVESARKGMEVCIKIEPIPGESPKMFGRHFDETDMLVSKISRQSIDACKDYFRDDLLKSDWQLMVELKKVFEIL